MPEQDPLVLSFSHLAKFSRDKEALHSLKKIASVVKPIMRARGWKVRELAEFYPDEANLLGLNVNRGQRILLRLRYSGDRNQFLPIEQVTDTMLHELCHIVHGPHDAKFHALWDQLREEYEGLISKGYTGEGFLSDGQRLGGRRVPMQEARRLARAAAERRRALGAGSGRRLGGAAPRPGQDMRRVIVGAIERRNRTLQGCGSGSFDDDEIQVISETATRNGFKTQAEEDAANEAAIAQALWELVQEDEKAKYGNSYIPPSALNPTGNGGGAVISETKEPPWPETQGASTTRSTSESKLDETQEEAALHAPARFPSRDTSGEWTCEVCTLNNPPGYLCCDACGIERPEQISKKAPERSTKRPRTIIDLTKEGRNVAAGPSATAPPPPPTWECSFCGNSMLREWWTCSACGKMKDSSK